MNREKVNDILLTILVILAIILFFVWLILPDSIVDLVMGSWYG